MNWGLVGFPLSILNALLLIYEFVIRDGQMVMVMKLFLSVYQDTFYYFILWLFKF